MNNSRQITRYFNSKVLKPSKYRHRGFLENRNSTIHRYLAAINAGADTSRKVSEKLGISIIASRLYTQMLRKEGFLRYVCVDKETRAIKNRLTGKGVEKLRFYETVKRRLE